MKQLDERRHRYTCYWKVEGSHEIFNKVKWLKQSNYLPLIYRKKFLRFPRPKKIIYQIIPNTGIPCFIVHRRHFFKKQLKVCSNYVEQFDWCILLQSSINITFIYTGKIKCVPCCATVVWNGICNTSGVCLYT